MGPPKGHCGGIFGATFVFHGQYFSLTLIVRKLISIAWERKSGSKEEKTPP